LAHKNAKLNNVAQEIHFINSDLFNSFPDTLKYSFDVILFNPPYLPSFDELNSTSSPHTEIDRTWDGGLMGIELTIRFLHSLIFYITRGKKSLVYFISSSNAELDLLNNTLSKLGYTNEIVTKEHIFFEDILLNRILIE
jgi:methylase of polypeptide subunit release factors